jgi:hypothetical protein
MSGVPGSPGKRAPARPTSIIRRVRAKAVISKGLMVLDGMNWVQSGYPGKEQGFFEQQELG